MFFFAKYLRDTLLTILICSDRIFQPIEYNYASIECKYQHKRCRQIKVDLIMVGKKYFIGD